MTHSLVSTTTFGENLYELKDRLIDVEEPPIAVGAEPQGRKSLA